MFGEGEKPMEPFSFSPKTILGRHVAFFGRRCFLSVQQDFTELKDTKVGRIHTEHAQKWLLCRVELNVLATSCACVTKFISGCC